MEKRKTLNLRSKKTILSSSPQTPPTRSISDSDISEFDEKEPLNNRVCRRDHTSKRLQQRTPSNAPSTAMRNNSTARCPQHYNENDNENIPAINQGLCVNNHNSHSAHRGSDFLELNQNEFYDRQKSNHLYQYQQRKQQRRGRHGSGGEVNNNDQHRLSLIPLPLIDIMIILFRLTVLILALAIIGYCCYFVFKFLKPKPRQTFWERTFTSVTDWLQGE
ncbi:unnamed protein product [Didymodactylos carnosus]|uniref:Uncharacterized protein n=1 Tax=Didymodactylos carnosus TaxID=1234261 RepID=A0A815IXS7_9BILA|nr:unnamed protein product [Didymodactylos carnosus]CAF1370731.1 unnamed protein product [Didymodactylos carnosus]CAF4033383.1 unnamed protein product [Didymodactylos carnosus]CAF4256809.1 unnamed protein product [Didymodactylos carnosus]